MPYAPCVLVYFDVVHHTGLMPRVSCLMYDVPVYIMSTISCLMPCLVRPVLAVVCSVSCLLSGFLLADVFSV